LAWTIEYTPGALKELGRLQRAEQRRIQNYLAQRVATADSPRDLGSALQGSRYGELWRYRVGDYRIICRLNDATVTVLVVDIGHRREIYR
jgi:mRNA interferase RelE/StbE